MKLQLTKGRPAPMTDIKTLETKLGGPLPRDVIDFVRKHNGAEPDANIFKVGTANESCVNGFIPVGEIASEMRYIENLPEKSFPFAWAEGGNYVLIDQSAGGAIFFWDHERPDDLINLADDLHAFLELLEPFDASAIKLQPGQVKKAWIDPDFLKSLGK